MRIFRSIFYIVIFVLVGCLATYFIRYPEEFVRLKNDVAQSIVVQKIFGEGSLPGPLQFLGGSDNAHLDTARIIEETNKRRKTNGVSGLVENPLLTKAAEAKLRDMTDKQYFEHVSPSGKGPSDLAKAAGYGYVLIGENLAMGNFENDSVLLDAWMNSPGHKANILNDRYKEIGVAAARVTYQGHTTWFAVQEFGKPDTDCTPTNAALKARIEVQEAVLRADEAEIARKKESLESRPPARSPEDRDTYNRDVEAYNSLIEAYKAKAALLQVDIANFNVQVRAYNACINS